MLTKGRQRVCRGLSALTTESPLATATAAAAAAAIIEAKICLCREPIAKCVAVVDMKICEADTE